MATKRPGPQPCNTHLQLRTSPVNGATYVSTPTIRYHGVVLQHSAATAVSDNELWATCDWTHANIWSTMGGSKEQPRRCLFWMLSLFFSVPQGKDRPNLTPGHNRFLPHFFQFTTGRVRILAKNAYQYRLSALMHQLVSHRTDIRFKWNWGLLWKFVENIQILLKLGILY
jgi:hypothetical protein